MKYSKVKAYKYKLEENFVRQTGIVGFNFATQYYEMLDDGTFLVKYGYAWDGSSIPHKKLLRIASLWIYNPDKYCKTASLIHDGLCQAMREGLLPIRKKRFVDNIYRRMCLEGGLSEKRASKRYWALRQFGDVGIQPEKNPRNKIYDTEE